MSASAARGARGARLERESGKAAVLAVVGVGVIALAGGAYYFLGVHLPGKKQGAAQGEIARWEERYTAARGCLLGDTTAGGSTREILAIRELSPDPWQRGTCTKLIGQLSRGETEDTGLSEVEDAWRGLDRAASGVGDAFLAHVDPAGEPAKGRSAERLPQALEALDAAHAALRGAAGMKPPPARGAAQQLPVAELIPLRDGGKAITKLSSWTMPTMGGVIAFGTAGDERELQLTLVPGAAPVAKPVGGGVLRTVPEAPWGAGGMLGQVVIGPLDEAGNLAPPLESEKDPRAVKIEGRGRVFAVAGTAESGLVIAGSESSLVVVRAEGGKLTADKPIAIEQLAFAIDPAGRAFVAYNDQDGKLRGILVRGAAPAVRMELGETLAGGACLTGKHAFIAGPESDQIVSYGTETGAVAPHHWEQHDLLGCTADAALLQKRGASSFVVCAEECRVATLQGMRPTKIAALAGGQVVSVGHRDRVLGVWREQGPPTYYALPEPLTELHLALGGAGLDVIAQAKSGVVIVRVPVK